MWRKRLAPAAPGIAPLALRWYECQLLSRQHDSLPALTLLRAVQVVLQVSNTNVLQREVATERRFLHSNRHDSSVEVQSCPRGDARCVFWSVSPCAQTFNVVQ